MRKICFVLIFIIVTALDLWQLQKGGDRLYTKPLIMLSLIGYYLLNISLSKGIHRRNLFLLAMFAALAGDLFLIWDHLFIYGLLSFLVMQLLYIGCFLFDRTKAKGRLIYIFGLAIIVIFVAQMLWQDLGAMMVPVLVYMLAISAMSYAAFIRDRSLPGYGMVLFGTLFFIISDAVLAIQAFGPGMKLGSLTVMSTYAAAQFFIVTGFILSLKTDGT